jgi:hypothetical protein
MDLKLFWEITNMQAKKESCKCPFCTCPRGDWLDCYSGPEVDEPPDLSRLSFIECLLSSLSPENFVPCTLHMYMRIANHFVEILYFSCLDAVEWMNKLRQKFVDKKIPMPKVFDLIWIKLIILNSNCWHL